MKETQSKGEQNSRETLENLTKNIILSCIKSTLLLCLYNTDLKIATECQLQSVETIINLVSRPIDKVIKGISNKIVQMKERK